MTFNKLNNLEGKVAVITGGAGQIGYATAIRLAEQKCRVIILTRKDTPKLREKINYLPNKELEHFFVIADITNTTTLKNAFIQISLKAKRCDILINSASSPHTRIKANDMQELTDELFDKILEINLRGVYTTIKTFLPLLKQNNDGLIINISSASSLRASEVNLAYSASKAALNHLTKCLSRVLAPNIRIIGIAPGYLEKAHNGYIRPESTKQQMLKITPLKRLICGDDIANTIISCATQMRFATGNIIVIDAGRTA
jgi:NAD(P)-dependent dehydrogenase (short-subunit alcohol dehydrogenase family)